MIVGVAILAERLSLTARWTMDESRRCPLLLPLFFFFFFCSRRTPCNRFMLLCARRRIPQFTPLSNLIYFPGLVEFEVGITFNFFLPSPSSFFRSLFKKSGPSPCPASLCFSVKITNCFKRLST